MTLKKVANSIDALSLRLRKSNTPASYFSSAAIQLAALRRHDTLSFGKLLITSPENCIFGKMLFIHGVAPPPRGTFSLW